MSGLVAVALSLQLVAAAKGGKTGKTSASPGGGASESKTSKMHPGGWGGWLVVPFIALLCCAVCQMRSQAAHKRRAEKREQSLARLRSERSSVVHRLGAPESDAEEISRWRSATVEIDARGIPHIRVDLPGAVQDRPAHEKTPYEKTPYEPGTNGEKDPYEKNPYAAWHDAWQRDPAWQRDAALARAHGTAHLF
jgi:hypothetical protein